MIPKNDLARWEKEEAQAQPKVLNAMVSEHTPLTTQVASLLLSGRKDGAILHLVDRNGTIQHIQLNAHLARLLATDIIEAGVAMDWLDSKTNIRTAPGP